MSTRAWEEKDAEEADTGGIISASINDGDDLSSFLETVLSDCDESRHEPTTPPEEVEGVNTTRSRRGVSGTPGDGEFAETRGDDEDGEGEDHFEDGASVGGGNDSIAGVPLLSREDCTTGRRVSSCCTYIPYVLAAHTNYDGIDCCTFQS